MSTRGRKLLDDWIENHLTVSATGDPVAASDLADEMMKAAAGVGIVPDEINDEVGSAFEVIFEAMHGRRGG